MVRMGWRPDGRNCRIFNVRTIVIAFEISIIAQQLTFLSHLVGAVGEWGAEREDNSSAFCLLRMRWFISYHIISGISSAPITKRT